MPAIERVSTKVRNALLSSDCLIRHTIWLDGDQTDLYPKYKSVISATKHILKSLVRRKTASQDIQESNELLEETIERENEKESVWDAKKTGIVIVIFGLSIAVFVYIVVKILTL